MFLIYKNYQMLQKILLTKGVDTVSKAYQDWYIFHTLIHFWYIFDTLLIRFWYSVHPLANPTVKNWFKVLKQKINFAHAVYVIFFFHLIITNNYTLTCFTVNICPMARLSAPIKFWNFFESNFFFWKLDTNW